MPELGTSGSVGAAGGKLPAATRLQEKKPCPIAVDAQSLECDGPARDVAAKALEFVALMDFASQRRAEKIPHHRCAGALGSCPARLQNGD